MSVFSPFLDARDLLRTWREDNVRRSDDVVDLWEAFLRDSATHLSDERWMILEQVRCFCSCSVTQHMLT
jgi:hypothetical protein